MIFKFYLNSNLNFNFPIFCSIFLIQSLNLVFRPLPITPISFLSAFFFNLAMPAINNLFLVTFILNSLAFFFVIFTLFSFLDVVPISYSLHKFVIFAFSATSPYYIVFI